MPKLTAVQWLLFAAIFAFYGFVVFAVTRDYYLHNPPQVAALPVPASQAPHALPGQGAQTFIQRELATAGDATVPAPTGDDPVELNRAGDELFSQERYADAIPYYRRVLEISPDDPDASNDLGLALHYTGQSAEALSVLRAGAALAPDFQRIWLTLGFVSAGASDAAGAREALEEAKAIDPNNGIGQEATRLLGLLQAE